MELGKGRTVKEVCQMIGIADQAYYRWRMDYNHRRPHSRLGWMTPAAFAARWMSATVGSSGFGFASSSETHGQSVGLILIQVGAENGGRS